MKYKIQFLENGKLVQKNIVLPYINDADKMVYNTGDYALHSSTVYRCKVDDTKGAWNGSNWDSTDLDPKFSWLEEALEKDGVYEDYDVVNISFAPTTSIVVLKEKSNG